MRPHSLRVRLLGLAVLAVLVALGTAGGALTIIFQRHIERRVAQELEQHAVELIAALATDEAGRVRLDHAPGDPRYGRPYGGAYWQVEQPGSAPLRSRSLWDTALSLPPHAAGDRTIEQQSGPGGADLDVLIRPITVRDAPVTVAVALDRAEVRALRRSFALDTAAALAILGSLLAAGAWVQAGIGLRPLATLRRRLAAVHEGQVGQLDGPFPSEVEPLVADLNRLFALQGEQVERARTGAGDLAHALKTPLTLIEGEAFRLGQAGSGDSAALLREQVAGMRRQVDRVLARARIHGLVAAGRPSADLGEVVGRLLAVMGRLPRGDALCFVNAVPAGLRIAVEGDDLAELLGNLIDNARKWASSTVRIGATAAGGRVTVSVVDDGPGVPPAIAERIGRGRFGSDDVEGSGLGLAIVRDLLAAYGTGLVIETPQEGGCRVSFTV